MGYSEQFIMELTDKAMEELENSDKKATTEQYIASYNYTTSQRVVATIAVLVVILGIVGATVYLFLNIVNVLNK